MKNARIVLSKIAHRIEAKSLRTSAALILATLMLMFAAATTVATAQTYTDLHNFYGAGSYGILAQGRDGNLYGTTTVGFCYTDSGCGYVFRIAPSGKLKVLYSFGPFSHGAGTSSPTGLTLGTDGDFYGTTYYGGLWADGTIYKITRSGDLTYLYSFTGGSDGVRPYAAPIQSTDGNFYGTTAYGNAYKMTFAGTVSGLGPLPGGSMAPLLQGIDGNFYGTTYNGGTYGDGTDFKMTAKGVVKVVYNFDGTHGETPESPLIQGSDGNFYGTTEYGGSNGGATSGGVVLKLTPQGALTVLHNFPDPNYPNDGGEPLAGLLQATDGNFYGVTSGGGTMGYGVIFQITPAGGYSILYNFDKAHGGGPESSPMQHTNGKLYGVTSYGGPRPSVGVFYSFDMGLGPFVSLVSASGKIGKTVEVLGQGFTGTTAVAFNGTAAAFKVVSDTYLTATVPTGATTGFVTVTTPSGTLTSNKQFRVTQ
jgi:uncharacterized repeat protein (TIGR03803 family)